MFIRSMLSAGIVASALIGTAATAAADLPNCTAGDLAGVMSGVNLDFSRRWGSGSGHLEIR